MKKLKYLLIGGLICSLALPALASNGNPRLNNSIPGTDSALVFCNTKPYQDDNATNGSLYLLVKNDHYFVDTTAYPGYTKYGVTKTLVTTTNGYIMLKQTGKYAVAPFTLGSPVGPADEPIESVTWYRTGIPDAPANLAVQAGFETAKVTWTLSSDYDYSSIELTVRKTSDGSIVYATGNTSPTVLSGRTTSYALGELVDGRVLMPGTEYQVNLQAKVKAKADNSKYYTSIPAAISFTTLSGVGGAQKKVYDLRIQLNQAQPGNNEVQLTWNFLGTTSVDIYQSDRPTGTYSKIMTEDIVREVDVVQSDTKGFTLRDGQAYFKIVPAGEPIDATASETVGIYEYTLRDLGYGINTIVFPFDGIRSLRSEVNDAQTLVEKINEQIQAQIPGSKVTMLGTWDAKIQQPVGFNITYDQGTMVASPVHTSGPSKLSDMGLKMTQAYQVSVDIPGATPEGPRDVKFVIVGKR